MKLSRFAGRHEQGAGRGEPQAKILRSPYEPARLLSVGDHAIVAIAEKPFPSGDGKRQNALKLVVPGLVGNVHAACKQREAAG